MFRPSLENPCSLRRFQYSDSLPPSSSIMMKSTMLLRALFASAILIGASYSVEEEVTAAGVEVGSNSNVERVIERGLFSTSSSLFEEWMTTHNKEYESIEERSLRFMIWIQNHGKFVYIHTYLCPLTHIDLII